MLDDEIQYMGTRSAPTAVIPSSVRPFPSPQNPVTGKGCLQKMSLTALLGELDLSGVVLHVQANGGQPACDMTFHRSQTSAVTIGRKSSSDHKSGPEDEDASTAGFACQVVSGKHAKLAFSDSGFVSQSSSSLSLLHSLYHYFDPGVSD